MNQIIDEVYRNYADSHWIPSLEANEYGDPITDWLNEYGDPEIYKKVERKLELIDKEWFIHEIKTNPEFSEKWGLKIEERELSFKERRNLAHEYAVSHNKLPLCIDAHGHEGIPKYHEVINKTGWNIPIKLITITYQENKIEVYE